MDRSEPFQLTVPSIGYVGSCSPVITDLEGDGAPEVFCDIVLLDGATGATRWLAPSRSDVYMMSSTVADLDLDGVAEIISGNEVLDADGGLRWEIQPAGSTAFPAAASWSRIASASAISR